jgi:hypothetical protein
MMRPAAPAPHPWARASSGTSKEVRREPGLPRPDLADMIFLNSGVQHGSLRSFQSGIGGELTSVRPEFAA